MTQEIVAFFDVVLTGVWISGFSGDLPGVLRGLAIRVKIVRPEGSQSSQHGGDRAGGAVSAKLIVDRKLLAGQSFW
jgi:hypothetical protein